MTKYPRETIGKKDLFQPPGSEGSFHGDLASCTWAEYYGNGSRSRIFTSWQIGSTEKGITFKGMLPSDQGYTFKKPGPQIGITL